jgi:hypothetical protein
MFSPTWRLIKFILALNQLDFTEGDYAKIDFTAKSCFDNWALNFLDGYTSRCPAPAVT